MSACSAHQHIFTFASSSLCTLAAQLVLIHPPKAFQLLWVSDRLLIYTLAISEMFPQGLQFLWQWEFSSGFKHSVPMCSERPGGTLAAMWGLSWAVQHHDSKGKQHNTEWNTLYSKSTSSTKGGNCKSLRLKEEKSPAKRICPWQEIKKRPECCVVTAKIQHRG